jgi:hypothetical protein
MCAASNLLIKPTHGSVPSSAKPTTAPIQGSTPSSAKTEPKWMKMKRLNKSSSEKTAKPIAKPSSAQQPSQTRNEKRARWAKKNRPVAKPVVSRGPAKEYLCECHKEPARKPRAGTKVATQDPETKKVKDTAQGLGKWHCATTGKITKVTPRVTKTNESPQEVQIATT